MTGKKDLFAANADALSQHNVEEVERAQAYLKRVREHLQEQTSDLNLLITYSATLAQDVAEAIVTTAEAEKGTGAGVFST